MSLQLTLHEEHEFFTDTEKHLKTKIKKVIQDC